MSELARRGAHGQFLPGVSGNPGGRPRQLRAVVELARGATEEAVAALRWIMNDPSAQGMARVRAAETLLQRAWGAVVPEQAIDSMFADNGEPISFRIVLGREGEIVEGVSSDADDDVKPQQRRQTRLSVAVLTLTAWLRGSRADAVPAYGPTLAVKNTHGVRKPQASHCFP